jgi:hypothetical protein
MPTGEDLAALERDVLRRVDACGAVARSEVDVPKGVVALLAEKLTAAGLELKPKVVRVAPEAQLLRRLARGSFPVKGLEKEIAGTTRAEARAALGKLVRAKRAVVLRGDGEGDVAVSATDVLTTADRARVAAVAKALTALAKPPGKSPLAPQTRWTDVMELVDDVLGGPKPAAAPATTRSAGRSKLEADLLAALRETRDESGIAAIATAARVVMPPPAADAIGVALRGLAARGDIELRIASQPHLLAPDERAICPKDAAGRVLAYARVVGS